MKTKLGISVAFMTALLYCSGIFGGLTVLLLVAGYVLLAEENTSLRQTAAKVLAIVFAFTLATQALSLIPDVLNIIPRLLSIFGVYFAIPYVDSIFGFLSNLLYLAQDIVLIVMGVFAVLGKNLPIKPLDDLVQKHIQ